MLAEVDVGLGRVGVSPGERSFHSRRNRKASPPALRGHHLLPRPHQDASDESGRHALAQLSDLLRGVLADFRAAGIEPGIVSGGSTPTLFHSHEIHGLTEIRPGTYVFNDLNTIRSGACALEDCAATILATVVSTARPGQMIIDGGSKTFSSDRLANTSEVTFGHLVEAPAARFHKMNEEHGFIDMSHEAAEFRVGDRVRVIPNHICVAVNLHEKVYGVRGDSVKRCGPWTPGVSCSKDFSLTGKEATDWDRYYKSVPFTAKLTRRYSTAVLLDAIQRHAAPDRQLAITEIGGANSCFMESILAKIPCRSYDVIDTNSYGLSLLEKKAGLSPVVRLHRQNVLGLSMDSKSDVAFSVGLVEHFDPAETRQAVLSHLTFFAQAALRSSRSRHLPGSTAQPGRLSKR